MIARSAGHARRGVRAVRRVGSSTEVSTAWCSGATASRRVPAIPGRAAPFDADLGVDAAGRLFAVYSRCTRSAAVSPVPGASRSRVRNRLRPLSVRHRGAPGTTSVRAEPTGDLGLPDLGPPARLRPTGAPASPAAARLGVAGPPVSGGAAAPPGSFGARVASSRNPGPLTIDMAAGRAIVGWQHTPVDGSCDSARDLFPSNLIALYDLSSRSRRVLDQTCHPSDRGDAFAVPRSRAHRCLTPSTPVGGPSGDETSSRGAEHDPRGERTGSARVDAVDGRLDLDRDRSRPRGFAISRTAAPSLMTLTPRRAKNASASRMPTIEPATGATTPTPPLSAEHVAPLGERAHRLLGRGGHVHAGLRDRRERPQALPGGAGRDLLLARLEVALRAACRRAVVDAVAVRHDDDDPVAVEVREPLGEELRSSPADGRRARRPSRDRPRSAPWPPAPAYRCGSRP